MPYGIKDETPEQTKWMDTCVGAITETNSKTGKPYNEAEKIAICKWNLKRNGMDDEASSELSMREELWQLEDKIREAIDASNGLVNPMSYNMWVADIFDDYVIIEKDAKMFKVPYTLSGAEVSVDWRSAIEVERKTVYEPKKEESSRSQLPVDSGRRITAGSRTIN